MTRGCGRIDGDGRFLTLELVYGADTCAGKGLLNLEDLGVVGCDDVNDGCSQSRG